MKWLPVMRWLTLGIVTAILLVTALCYLFRPRDEKLFRHFYDAGTVSSASGHDIWFEYGGPESTLVGIYRDFDGDGLIDEHLMFFSSKNVVRCFAVNRDSGKDGILDIERWIWEPPGVQHQREQSPGEQPLTREHLDKLLQQFPRFPPAEQ